MERVTDTHVFFWGGEFSNWYECPFKYKGLSFSNTEQAFMWEKAIFFNDMETAEKILRTPNPKENKALGRRVKNFDVERWMINSFTFMVAVNYAKYSQKNENNKHFRCEKAREILLSTGDKILVEASPYDKIWGIGLHWNDDDCLDETKWKGMNLLGKALMQVRKMISEE